jgi:ribosomal protein L23
MKIKNIITACLVCCGFAAAFTSCSKDKDGFYTVSETDSPRILNTDFEHEDPDNADSPIVFKIDRNQNLTFDILVTPTDLTTVNWYADDILVHQGKTIDRAFEAGNYTLKIVAVTTAGKETSRTAKLIVKALENDPIATDDVMERLQTPGAQQQITGTRLGNIKKVAINGREMEITSQSDSYINYVLPADMPVGQYRLSLIDADGVSYGGGLITISGEVVVSKAKFSGQSKGQLNLQGRKLSEVANVTVNGTACEIINKDETSMAVKLPEMEEGTYELKATTNSGTAVKFLSGSEMVETAVINITLIVENVLWEGEWNVTWGTPFDGVQNTFADNVHVGALIHVYVNGTAGAQGCLATAWWRNIYTGGEEGERGDVTFEGEYVLKYILTEKSMELMKEQNGVLVVGNGYTVTKISVVEQTVWEGEHDVTWGSPFDGVQNTLPEQVHPGTTVRLYVNGAAGAQGCLATAWWRNIITGGEEAERGDRFFEGEAVLDFTLTEKSMELMKEQNGVLVVGNGYTLTKVAIM